MSHGSSDKCEPNFTPLLDLVLQLVMFFMLCANFVMDQTSVEIKLPDAIASFGAAVEGYWFSDASPTAPRDGGIRLAGSVSARSWLAVRASASATPGPSASSRAGSA